MEINDKKDFSRIMAIDYLKAIAATLVILTHTLSKSQRIKIGGPYWISMAVPIFMIISGFTNTLSADKSNFTSLGQFYKKDKLLPEISTILSPYIIIILLEFLLGFYELFFWGKGPFIAFKLKDYLIYFLTGGTKPGSYYIPILFQFILVFPILFILYKKSPKKAIILFLSIHFIFDLFANYLSLPTKIYRLLIFRYLGFIILGIALYHSYFLVKRLVKWLSLLSIAYITAYTMGYRIHAFSKWPNTALPTIFWALALVILGMEYLEKEPINRLSYLFSRLGKASYHIFLVQKIVFGFGLNKYFKLIEINIILRVVLLLIVCSFLGLLFYELETESMTGEMQ